MWFRRDLRLSDQRALEAASATSPVIGLFVLDPVLLAGCGPARAHYLVVTLRALRESMNGALVLRVGGPGEVLREVCRESGATRVVITEDFAPYGRARDERVEEELASIGVELVRADTPYAVRPGTARTAAGTPPKVFTPFFRSWEASGVPGPQPLSSDPQWVTLSSLEPEHLFDYAGRARPELFAGLEDPRATTFEDVGEAGAWARLEEFLTRVDRYGEGRNQPGEELTSRLSPHLRFGTLHPRQVLAAAQGSSASAGVFRSEVAWREFYGDVLFHHPESAWRALQTSMERLRVDEGPLAHERFRAWARGETGYPLVDAGMRQLLAEGWMHNRVRMVCASFLVKHLHLDWRWGARWFLWCLIDADLASNQHGWQWTAGTGTDAAPFHRVFNPTLQAERFDPDGVYVRRYVAELATVPSPQCLQPGGGAGLLAPAGYPAPLVDAARERDEALARFAEVRAPR
ncbi:MAG: deoxyribodipyrimidine photo-lyase [Acidimicrobiaceae bacterium]|nr:deoxyribodipyrimidine photo-lyase [Acidimicrobiaceae bacterium]